MSRTSYFKKQTVTHILQKVFSEHALEDKKNGVVVIRNSFGQAVDVDQLQAEYFGNVDQWLEVR